MQPQTSQSSSSMSYPDCSVIVRGCGSYAPEKILTNEDISKIVDTSDEWIVTRTGIRERRISADNQSTSDLAVEAVKRALAMANMEATQMDFLIVATLTPDMLFPSTACIVQQKLGMRPVPAFDVDAACSGFVYALDVARALLKANPHYRRGVVVGAEKLSTIIDWDDRSTCVLFGDGAGAVVLERKEEPGHGILGVLCGADGRSAPLIHMPGGGSDRPATAESVQNRLHFLRMNGREVFKLAVRAMTRSAEEILQLCNLQLGDIEWVIPHQANQRIIESVAQYLKLPMDRFANNVHAYGNTSAASVPLALDEAVRDGRIKAGDHVLMIAFGAGLTWGATIIEWNPSL